MPLDKYTKANQGKKIFVLQSGRAHEDDSAYFS